MGSNRQETCKDHWEVGYALRTFPLSALCVALFCLYHLRLASSQTVKMVPFEEQKAVIPGTVTNGMAAHLITENPSCAVE